MTSSPFDPGILAAFLNAPELPSNWKQSYFDGVIDRSNRRIASLKDRIDGIATGKTMPSDSTVAIGSGKRFELTIMFLDITGFTNWPSGISVEQDRLMYIMDVFMAEMMNIVRDHGGTFEKNTGDGLMVYFGTDTAAPTASVRSAVEAAVMMHFVNDTYISPWLSANGLWQVPFRVGIDYGKVTIAKIGIHGTNTFVAVGATANVANRLLRSLSTGIAIGDRVYHHLPKNWNTRCKTLPPNTGYVYRDTGTLYPVWELTHRLYGYPVS